MCMAVTLCVRWKRDTCDARYVVEIESCWYDVMI
jgi:hypothetical protein